MKTNRRFLLIRLVALVSVLVLCLSELTSNPALGGVSTGTPRWTPTLIASVTPGTATNISRGTPTGGSITIEGVPSYAGMDADGNGLFEWLQVNAPVRVARSDRYYFEGYLSSKTGKYWLPMHGLDTARDRQMRLESAKLDAGAHTVAMFFDGRYLHNEGMDGPYTIVVRVYDSGDRVPSDSVTFSTLAYPSKDFQGLLIENLSLSDSGVDTDGIPGYDVLRISAHFNMAAAGIVDGRVDLFGKGGRLQILDLPPTYLAAGPQTLDIDFPGAELFSSRTNGPYDVSVSLRDQYFPADDLWYTTKAYTNDQFQPPTAYFTKDIQDTGNDLNGDGLYDELLISTHVITATAGHFIVDAILRDISGNTIDTYSSDLTVLDAGSQAVMLHFKGTAIAKHGVDGPYRVLIAVEENDPPNPNRDHVTLDGLRYETKPYPATAFQPPAARLSGLVTDSGVDTDGDGGYDVLRLRVGVNVVQAGRYRLSASLFDAHSTCVAMAQTKAIYLEPGAQTVDLDFSGATLRASKSDGPYRLVMLDLDQEGVGMIDVRHGDYLTAAYPYTAFRPTGPVFLDSFSDQGEDTNGNGLYEYLTIKVKVLIVKAGQYDFNASLSDSAGKEIFRAVGSQYLAVGDQWIALKFDGRYIYGQQANGSYKMGAFTLYFNYPDQVLGEGLTIYTTGPYDWHQFEPGVAISGTVTMDGKPLSNVLVFIGGIDTDYTNSSGRYRLTALNSGPVTIDIDRMLGPWQIWVNGKLEAVGTHITIQAVVGMPVEINFVKAP